MDASAMFSNISIKLFHDGGRYRIEISPLSMDWFLYDNGLRHERVKEKAKTVV